MTPKYNLNEFYYMVHDTKTNKFIGRPHQNPTVVKTRSTQNGWTKGGFNHKTQKRYKLQKFALAPVPFNFKF